MRKRLNSAEAIFRRNLTTATRSWGQLSGPAKNILRNLTTTHFLRVDYGDLILLEGRWYVTHSGLLRVAHQNRCRGMRTVLLRTASEPSEGRWVFKATVYKSAEAAGFTAYGDADPSNVSPIVRGAEMRIAETRAVNRALRKAYGIGLCSVEELGSEPRSMAHLKTRKLRQFQTTMAIRMAISAFAIAFAY